MEKLGLVFAGGGGKGAYQIGVWRALWQHGLDKAVCAVSGTSVGALNAALFAQGDLTLAEQVWGNLSPEQVLCPSDITESDELEQVFSLSYFGTHSPVHLLEGVCPPSFSTPVTATPKLPLVAGTLPLTLRLGHKALGQFAANRLLDGIISNKGLEGMIEESLDFSRLAHSPVACYASCYRIFPGFGVERFQLGQHDKAYDTSVLLASAAIPIFFPAVQVGKGAFYWDGGIPKLGDNVPVAPVYQDGCCNKIIIVHLKDDDTTPRDSYPQSELIDIFPSKSLGGTAATFDFTEKGAQYRLDLGYRDGLDMIARRFPS